ncbi:DUF3500 domain-containing protein [Dyadobacter diqingensis]|uniref:DUF3500 domain-containing protein n=1 Tax=Dyadobacter diqingensis TaxID=2938121 RepID=UPI0020C18FE1|nr:DUF3500 domain-containing protein [Dyadobacter diqingensis]
MKSYPLVCKLFLFACFITLFKSGSLQAQDKLLVGKLSTAVQNFTGSLDATRKKEACVSFADSLRFDWNYVPRARKGLTLKNMNADQQAKAFEMVRIVLSAGGYQKTREIIDLENVLRVIENKSANDTYRDPENYAFLIFGKPGEKEPWGWRLEGHHISLHFTVAGDEITFTPGFFGSNPGIVLADVPQKGKRILKDEQDVAFELLHSFSAAQQKTIILSEKAPWEILSSNKRSKLVKLKPEGIAMKDMTPAQKKLFQKLIAVYLDRYHVTLKNQQMNKLKGTGLDGIHFAWMGKTDPEIKDGAGYYYRIQGPTILIELDNTQNNANHIHTVVRDLTNDFGEDLLRAHYEKMHANH